MCFGAFFTIAEDSVMEEIPNFYTSNFQVFLAGF